jgi:hypothetical protein
MDGGTMVVSVLDALCRQQPGSRAAGELSAVIFFPALTCTVEGWRLDVEA